MTPVWWMIGVSAGSWLLISAVARGTANPEVLLGMAGPLTSAVATWLLLVRTHASAPERVFHVLAKALAGKMVFFAAYVALMLRALALRPTWFVVSFTAYFIGLYAMQAMFLRRLR
jgi:hypothetical protein